MLGTSWTKAVTLAAAFVIAATATGGFFGAVLLLPSWPQNAQI